MQRKHWQKLSIKCFYLKFNKITKILFCKKYICFWLYPIVLSNIKKAFFTSNRIEILHGFFGLKMKARFF